MRIKSQKDFWCGALFVALGVAFVMVARNYRLGTAARMGPGFFPTWLGAVLAGLGLMLAVPALWRHGERFERLPLRPLLTILTAIAVFALLLQPLGFVLAAVVMIVLCSFADPEQRLVETAGLAILLTAFSVAIFVGLLGLPLSLWPDL
ncbi:MAG: tripartite tricarboxylate transporter TctB family protein [Hyphomicrobiales bacterium]|nr:tripartite tricarboxylate transporter TctB family protein [Hyphomicrobiales bacterium]